MKSIFGLNTTIFSNKQQHYIWHLHEEFCSSRRFETSSLERWYSQVMLCQSRKRIVKLRVKGRSVGLEWWIKALCFVRKHLAWSNSQKECFFSFIQHAMLSVQCFPNCSFWMRCWPWSGSCSQFWTPVLATLLWRWQEMVFAVWLTLPWVWSMVGSQPGVAWLQGILFITAEWLK